MFPMKTEFLSRKTLALALLVSCFFSTSVNAENRFAGFASGAGSQNQIAAKPFWRTELFFGTAKPDGSQISEDEWRKFLADEVTPRFPDGFTILPGYGQFRGANGEIVRENSFVLVILYSLNTRKSSRRKIEQIRRAYMKAFAQQSVLRVDFPQAVQVSF
jgi:hypothetical protein